MQVLEALHFQKSQFQDLGLCRNHPRLFRPKSSAFTLKGQRRFWSQLPAFLTICLQTHTSESSLRNQFLKNLFIKELNCANSLKPHLTSKMLMGELILLETEKSLPALLSLS